MTALILKHLDIRFRWNFYDGTFENVKDYLIDAYTKAIDEIKQTLGNSEFSNDLIDIIKYCCYPIPEQRGHKKNLCVTGNQYSFQRAISKLDLIKRKIIYKYYTN